MDDIGLVLGGGGAKGAYQMGAWKAIVQTKLNNHIKIYAGTSVGAINCALIQITDYEHAIKIWLHYDLEKIFMSKAITYNEILEIINNLRNRKKVNFDGILSRDGLLELFEEIKIDNLEKSREDFIVCVVNISQIPQKERLIKPAIDWYEGRKTGFTQYLNIKNTNKDYIIKVLTASSALPVIYTPVEIDEQYYVDGGINDNLPIEPIYRRGCKKIIAVSCDKINYRNLKRKYPSSQILLIQPSKNLGSLISGTLNFNKQKLRQTFRLGYFDAMYAIKRSNFFNRQA